MIAAVARRVLRIAAAVAVIVAAAYAFRGPLLRTAFGPGDPGEAARGATVAALPQGSVETLATGLEVPWGIAWSPDGALWITERPGRLVRLPAAAWRGDPDPEGAGARRVSVEVPGVAATGEGGLMGVALDPDFRTSRRVYLALTYRGPDGVANRVDRYRIAGGDGGFRLVDRTPVVTGIPGASFHDGGRIAFGPAGRLWVTTGDAGRGERARETASLAGKILRLAADGSVPGGNPFGTPVWSYGHRNPQGLAWAPDGTLWSTEHGPSGLGPGQDEVNRIERGGNYGWPGIRGDERAQGMRTPVRHSGEATWAPAGAAWVDGSLFFGGLRGEGLYELRVETGAPGEGGAPPATSLRVHFFRELGRIRAVRVGPDGLLYFTTSNRDGRGRVREGDDRLLRVDPAVLREVGGRDGG